MRPTRVRLAGSLLVAATLTAACSQQPLKFNAIQLGRSLNADKTVSGFTTRFKPTDTILRGGIDRWRWLGHGQGALALRRPRRQRAATGCHLPGIGLHRVPHAKYDRIPARRIYRRTIPRRQAGRLQIFPRRDRRPQRAIHLSQHDAEALSERLPNGHDLPGASRGGAGDRPDVGEHAAGVPGWEGSNQRRVAVELDAHHTVAWAQLSWPACHLTKASASAVM